jgi:hypothetical protein
MSRRSIPRLPRVAFEKLEKRNVGDRSLPVLKNIEGLKKLLKS